MHRLSNLTAGDRFTWNNIPYIVVQHEGLMTEVYGNGRVWAWPTMARVQRVR